MDNSLQKFYYQVVVLFSSVCIISQLLISSQSDEINKTTDFRTIKIGRFA
jgi:hypothetical protein